MTLTIEQTVEIPASRRLFIEVPPEVPLGRTILTFTPAPVAPETGTPMSVEEALAMGRGIAKGGRFTCDRLFEYRREDAELEEAQYRRDFRTNGDPE